MSEELEGTFPHGTRQRRKIGGSERG
jgi:hypothetical protein